MKLWGKIKSLEEFLKECHKIIYTLNTFPYDPFPSLQISSNSLRYRDVCAWNSPSLGLLKAQTGFLKNVLKYAFEHMHQKKIQIQFTLEKDCVRLFRGPANQDEDNHNDHSLTQQAAKKVYQSTEFAQKCWLKLTYWLQARSVGAGNRSTYLRVEWGAGSIKQLGEGPVMLESDGAEFITYCQRWKEIHGS